MKEYSNMFRVCPSGQTLSMYNHFVNPCPLSRSHSSTPQLKLILSLPATLFKLLPRPARARIIRIHFLLRHLYRPVQPIGQVHQLPAVITGILPGPNLILPDSSLGVWPLLDIILVLLESGMKRFKRSMACFLVLVSNCSMNHCTLS